MLNEYQAELCGLFAGDGWINSRRNTVFICGSVKEKEFYDKHVRELFEKGLNFTPKLRHFPYWSVYGVAVYSKSVTDFFKAQGFNEGKKVLTVKIPNEILSSKNLWPFFLRGIFDSDGSIYFEKNYAPGVIHKQRRRARMEIGSASKDLIGDLYKICVEIGYQPTVRIQKPSGKGRHNSYKLRFNRKDDVLRWFKEISPKNNVHISRFKKWQKFGYY
jgi:intein/homing endonuclease